MFIEYSFTKESMQEILLVLKVKLSNENQNEVTLEVLNPDFCSNCYAGKELEIEGERFIYRLRYFIVKSLHLLYINRILLF